VFAERFAEQGWLRINGLFPRELVDAARAGYDDQFETLVTPREGHRGYTHADGDDKRFILTPRLTGAMLDPALWANPLVMAILAPLLGNDLLIDNLTIVTAFPGARDQQLHRDHAPLFPEQPQVGAGLNPYAITLVIPLIDLDEHTGTTRLVTGSHRGIAEGPSEFPLVQRGDCFLMDYRLAHLGTANRSDRARPMLFIVYTRPWFTDIRNLKRQERLRLSREDLAALPPAHWPLFRRLATKGGLDFSQRELFPET
jgi:hypothetical protein